jgi:diguanylate cyclase (GGDEF)-like protein
VSTARQSLRALIVEDSDDDAMLLVHELRRGHFAPQYHRVETKSALRQALQESWDIVFSDFSMPTMSGLDALQIVRELDQDIPFVFVSGTIGEGVAVEAMRNGAQDYIMKSSMMRLGPVVMRELDEARSRRLRHQAERKLYYLAHFDELTGLPNRAELMLELTAAISAASVSGHRVAMVFLDIDKFKTFNDSLGYEAGNLLLIEAANRLRNCLGNPVVIARLAADEFAILLNDVSSRQEVTEKARQIEKAFSEPFQVCGCTLYVGASVGLSLYPDDADSGEGLLRNADIATYRVKREGGNNYRFYSPDMAVNLDERLALDHAMRQALEKQEFLLHYQPQVYLTSGRLSGVEVLIRWNRGQQGVVPPRQFIPLAEDTGFIQELGAWIIREACAQARRWLDAGHEPMQMVINLSARQFFQRDLANIVSSALRKFALPPDMLELEITETAMIQDPNRALESLQTLQELGVKVSLDDFGTGYSSLSHLTTFKVDSLKVDRSFMMGIPNDLDAMTITAAVIVMASRLGIKVVAEGVETSEQREFLVSEGCQLAQGYLMGRPMTAEQFDVWLSACKTP